MGLFSTIRFNIRLSIYAKFAEFLKSSMVKARLKVFLDFLPKVMFKLCLSFNESQPVYAYKRYAYKKRVYCICV